MNYAELASKYGWNPAFLEAVTKVESSGRPFDANGFPRVRFEPHVFNKRSKQKMPFTDSGRGFSRVPSETNLSAFNKALELDRVRAIESTSFGAFQIMGFNWKRCGATSAEHFFELQKTLQGQTECFTNYVSRNKKLNAVMCKPHVTLKDCEEFARTYNGPSNVKAYSTKLYAFYEDIA